VLDIVLPDKVVCSVVSRPIRQDVDSTRAMGFSEIIKLLISQRQCQWFSAFIFLRCSSGTVDLIDILPTTLVVRVVRSIRCVCLCVREITFERKHSAWWCLFTQ